MSLAIRAVQASNNGAGGTTIRMYKPTGTDNGDVLVMGLTLRGGTGTTITTPTGWTDMSLTTTISTTLKQCFYWKLAAAEPSYWDVTITSSQASGVVVALVEGAITLPTGNWRSVYANAGAMAEVFGPQNWTLTPNVAGIILNFVSAAYETSLASPPRTLANPTAITLSGTASSPGVYLPDSSKFYCATSGKKIDIINTTTNAVTSVTLGTQQGYYNIMAPNGSYFYTNDYGSPPKVYRLKTADNTLTSISMGTNSQAFHGWTMSHDGAYIYVCLYIAGHSTLAVISTATFTVTQTITVGTDPYGVVATPDGNWVYVWNQTDNTISKISTSSWTVVATIATTITPGVSNIYWASTPDSTKVVFVTTATRTGIIIDVSTNSVTQTPALGVSSSSQPYTLLMSPDSTYAYIGDYPTQATSITRLNIAANTVSLCAPASGTRLFTQNIIVNSLAPDGSVLYVTANGPIAFIRTSDFTSLGVLSGLGVNVTLSTISLAPSGLFGYVFSNTGLAYQWSPTGLGTSAYTDQVTATNTGQGSAGTMTELSTQDDPTGANGVGNYAQLAQINNAAFSIMASLFISWFIRPPKTQVVVAG